MEEGAVSEVELSSSSSPLDSDGVEESAEATTLGLDSADSDGLLLLLSVLPAWMTPASLTAGGRLGRFGSTVMSLPALGGPGKFLARHWLPMFSHLALQLSQRD